MLQLDRTTATPTRLDTLPSSLLLHSFARKEYYYDVTADTYLFVGFHRAIHYPA